jgi:hypothetical protein
LCSSREHYREISAASRDAALNFVAGLDVGNIETVLENRAARPHSAARAQSLNARLDLSPQRLELLAALVSQNRGIDAK